MKTLILYAYYKNDVSKDNLNFFIKNGYIDNELYTFIFIINNFNVSVSIPDKRNIIVHRRVNEGFDFGAWSVGLSLININDYSKFIFINGSSIGPFVPRYIPKNITWIDLMTSMIDDNIKLVGPTINYGLKYNFNEHIQSHCFATDLIGLKLLVEHSIFIINNTKNKWDIVVNHEVKMSKIIMDNKYKLYAFQLSENYFENIIGKEKKHDDIHYDGEYFGSTINPLEVMFLKSNRINNLTLTLYKEFNRNKY
jgi:hypothetical protein